jgi:hypothetical protein
MGPRKFPSEGESLQGATIPLEQAPVPKVKLVGHSNELKASLRYDPKRKAYVATLTGLPLDVEESIEATAADNRGPSEQTIAAQIGLPTPKL